MSGAATNYVSLTGSDVPPYDTWAKAATSIQTAVDAASDGDTVLVADGTYTHYRGTSITNGITLRSVNGATESTIVGGNFGSCIYAGHQSATISGFTLKADSTGSVRGARILGATIENCVVTGNHIIDWGGAAKGAGIYVSGGVVRNCRIRDNHVAAYTSISFSPSAEGGGIYAENGAIIEDSFIIDNVAQGGPGTAGGGVVCKTGSTIRRCRIRGNRVKGKLVQGGGVYLSGGSALINSTVDGNVLNSVLHSGGWIVPPFGATGGGIFCTDSSVRNCTIANNVLEINEKRRSFGLDGQTFYYDALYAGAGLYSRADAQVQNTVIFYNHVAMTNVSSAVIVPEAQSVVLGINYYADTHSNDYSHCCSTPLPPGPGNIDAYPGFINPDSGDFRLSATSACIDSGTAGGAPPIDIDGVARPIDGDADGTPVVDIGAYEFAPPGYIPPNTTIPTDFDGDGAHDLGIYDTATGNWWGKAATADGRGKILSRGRNWGGWATAVPVPGNYHGSATSAYEIAVYDTSNGNWFHRSHTGDVRPQNWGYPGVTPVANDFDGDGMTDLAVFDGRTAQWWINSISNGVILAANNTWGEKGFRPVPADYNGDGICDLGVYDRETFMWHIRSVSGNIIAKNIWWGYTGTVPIPINYDSDPAFELAAYDPATGMWHIADVDGSNIWLNVNWGFPGALPAPANYDGDVGNSWELGVYHPDTGNWYIRGLNNTTPANWGWPGSTVIPLGAAR